MLKQFGSLMCSLVLLSGCNTGNVENLEQSEGNLSPISETAMAQTKLQSGGAYTEYAVATFAGGCFWCTESDFEKVPGVIDAVSGYIDGHVESPTYSQVSAGKTGHVEAVEVHYDAEKVDFNRLLESYWRQVDPTDSGGQFVDRGYQYRPVIFYHDEMQKTLALASYEQMAKSGRYDKAVTLEIKPASKFWPAEEYHQDYYKKNPIRYKFYRYNSGRDQYLETVWGEDLELPVLAEPKKGDMKMSKQTYTRPSDEEIKAMLSPLQYKVTQKEGTERPFDNEYNDEKRAGIFVDIVSGEPLFSSTDKFDSGTGWPSFTKPLVEDHIVEKKDYRLILPRVEVRSKFADSHLGHVFTDGPAPTGLRYCINSAALKFIPKESLAAQGYSDYLALFEG